MYLIGIYRGPTTVDQPRIKQSRNTLVFKISISLHRNCVVFTVISTCSTKDFFVWAYLESSESGNNNMLQHIPVVWKFKNSSWIRSYEMNPIRFYRYLFGQLMIRHYGAIHGWSNHYSNGIVIYIFTTQ
jgi:hypothetical protein